MAVGAEKKFCSKRRMAMAIEMRTVCRRECR
jgi:hypothetical protein